MTFAPMTPKDGEVRKGDTQKKQLGGTGEEEVTRGENGQNQVHFLNSVREQER